MALPDVGWGQLNALETLVRYLELSCCRLTGAAGSAELHSAARVAQEHLGRAAIAAHAATARMQWAEQPTTTRMGQYAGTHRGRPPQL